VAAQAMTLTAINQHSRSSSSGVFPALILVQGNEQKNIVLNRTPFSVGRKVDKDLVIADPRVSRDHAQILLEDGEFFLVDQGSKHGTFVNGERIQRQKLEHNDRLEFGARDSAYVIFNPAQATSNTAREFLSQISAIQIPQEATDLQKLTLFLEAARKLKKQHPDMKVIFVTMHADAPYIKAAFKAGASGYLLKRSAGQELIQAIQVVMKGEFYLTPLITKGVISGFLDPTQIHVPAIEDLTARQREILQLVAEGYSAKEIASQLKTSHRTVEFHKAKIMEQLHLHSTTDLVKFAMVHGLVTGL